MQMSLRVCLNIVESFLQVIRVIFSNDKYDIIFYYPQHFNRGRLGDNPYLEKFITTCKNKGVKYLLVEEPDYDTDAPKGKGVFGFAFILFLILFMRKVIKVSQSFEAREQQIGRVINFLTFSRLQSPLYVTLSNSLGGVLRGISPEAEIYDYQHGIVSSTQPGYFCAEGATSCMKENNKKVLVYGRGFEDIFLANDPYYKERLVTLGDSCAGNCPLVFGGKMILISPQMTVSMSKERNYEQIRLLVRWLSLSADFINKYGIKVLLNHHPRFNHCVDASELYEFPFLENVTGHFDLATDRHKIALQVTFYSTTAFDCARFGIPSVFLTSDKLPEGNEIFGQDYKYPYIANTDLETWEFLWSDSPSNAVADEIRHWYERFYQPFNEALFLEILSKHKN